MKICITDNGVQVFLKAFILENMMTITPLWYSCVRVEVQHYPNAQYLSLFSPPFVIMASKHHMKCIAVPKCNGNDWSEKHYIKKLIVC